MSKSISAKAMNEQVSFTLRGILDSPEAMAAVGRIEGWRALGYNVIETIINKSDKAKNLKNKAREDELSAREKKELSDEEKEYKSKRKLVQEKLIKFATRIPAFIYLSPVGATQGVQYRADEPGGVCVSAL